MDGRTAINTANEAFTLLRPRIATTSSSSRRTYPVMHGRSASIRRMHNLRGKYAGYFALSPPQCFLARGSSHCLYLRHRLLVLGVVVVSAILLALSFSLSHAARHLELASLPFACVVRPPRLRLRLHFAFLDRQLCARVMRGKGGREGGREEAKKDAKYTDCPILRTSQGTQFE